MVRQSAIATNAQSRHLGGRHREGATLKANILQGNADKQGFAKVMGFVLAFSLLASPTFGMRSSRAVSVVEEKGERIVEIIATKIRCGSC